jgi:hypothetical protein
MDSNQASEQVQFSAVKNSHGNQEFESLLKLFVKNMNIVHRRIYAWP